MVPAGRCERCAHFGVGQSTRQRHVTGVPQRGGDVGADLVEHELDESTRVEVDEGHLQRRCSLTMSATGRFGVGRDRPPATGRVDRAGRLMTPCAVKRSMTGVESRATILATGVPRSVMTMSCPSRAASIHRPRCALSSVTATSMFQVYISANYDLYRCHNRSGRAITRHSSRGQAVVLSRRIPASRG